ncbi:MAG: prepilin-type N-terminal cleavage/methylation domain-containing protein [Planctomycetes bacterium]|nr:prepilin-type N-terminal cleavage/methylation domain-containing protein [Planctomycetota bacterium]
MVTRRGGFTLVEVFIVVLIIGILAMVVVPRVVTAAEQAKESTLETDLLTIRRAAELYRAEHGGRLPHLDEGGNVSLAGIVWRMTLKTTAEGKLDDSGECGPYLPEWPTNPYVPGPAGQQIKGAAATSAPRDDSSGWYYSTTTGLFHVNSARGALELDP